MVVASASKARRLGTKHRCAGCGTRFYDFDKPAPRCPKCGERVRDRAPRSIVRVDLLATSLAANTNAITRRGRAGVDLDEPPSRLLSGLSQEEVELARQDDPERLAELLVTYDW